MKKITVEENARRGVNERWVNVETNKHCEIACQQFSITFGITFKILTGLNQGFSE